MSKQVILTEYYFEDFSHLLKLELTDSGTLFITDLCSMKNDEGKMVEHNNLICLIPEQVEQLKELLKNE